MASSLKSHRRTIALEAPNTAHSSKPRMDDPNIRHMPGSCPKGNASNVESPYRSRSECAYWLSKIATLAQLRAPNHDSYALDDTVFHCSYTALILQHLLSVQLRIAPALPNCCALLYRPWSDLVQHCFIRFLVNFYCQFLTSFISGPGYRAF